MLHRVKSEVGGKGQILMPMNGLSLSVEDIEQERGAIGLFEPTVKPPITKQRVG